MEIDQIKKMFDIVKASSNPMSMLQSMASSNPNLKQAMQSISSNENPKDVFYKIAKERGMSDKEIDDFLTSIRSILKT